MRIYNGKQQRWTYLGYFKYFLKYLNATMAIKDDVYTLKCYIHEIFETEEISNKMMRWEEMWTRVVYFRNKCSGI